MGLPRIRIHSALLLAAFALGCAKAPEAVDGFVLPEGDANRGEEVFMSRRCYDCHLIPGVDLPVAEEPGQVQVVLGGPVTKVQSYNDLITSIINPSHQLSEPYAEALVSRGGVSNMTTYNDVMTISELIDLVSYLQGQYKVVEPSSSSEYVDYE